MASQKEEIKEARRRRLNWIIVFFLVVGVTFLSLPSFEYFRLTDLEVGSPSPRTFTVDQEYRVVDRARTREQLRERKAEIQPEFLLNKSVQQSIQEDIRKEIEALRDKAENRRAGMNLPEGEDAWRILSERVRIVTEYLFDRGLIHNKELFDRFKHQSTGELRIHAAGGGPTTSRPARLL